MARLRLTLTYEYDANPEDYFDEVPEPLTQEAINEMIATDSGEDNIGDFLNYVITLPEAKVVIESVD